MIQRIKNTISINVTGIDLTTVTDIEVFFKQKSTNVEFKAEGNDINVISSGVLSVIVPKEEAMKLDYGTVLGQIAFKSGNTPKASLVFNIPVEEFIGSDGYGD